MSADGIVKTPTNPSSQHFHPHDATGDGLTDALIRGNMQYINGELKKIPRPLNAFMIFSNEKRKALKKEYPGEPNNMISSRLGAAWKSLSDDARKRYHDMAHREDLEHRRKYPNYQYCPGHARKLKKARREQRLRQQNSSFRNRVGAPYKNTKPTDVLQENPMAKESSLAQKRNPQQIVHGIMGQMGSVPGPHGEGAGFAPGGYVPMPGDGWCCCTQCKSATAEMYGYCADSWSNDSAAPPPFFAHSPQYGAPVVYLPYDAQYAAEKLGWPSTAEMMQQPCMLGPNECAGCYAGQAYMQEASYQDPQASAGGDFSNAMYKEMCFDGPASMTSPTPVTTIGSVNLPAASEQEPELMDISNNMVPAHQETEHGSEFSQRESPEPQPADSETALSIKEEVVEGDNSSSSQ